MSEYRILKDLVKFNTIKDKDNKEIIDYIEKYLIKLNFRKEYKGKYLIMSIGENPKIGFLGHTDTVEYIDGWNTNPFELTNINNKLYGLGTCDMKGGIAAILDAVSKVELANLQYGMKLYFTYDEEIGFGGIYDIIDTKEVFPEIMIFGEPTNNEMLVGSKGLLEYELNFKGIKAHSSNPEKGKSANMNAVNFLSELDEFYNKKIKIYTENYYEVPYTTMNVGIINGGSAKNSVSENCNVSIDFRIANKKHIDVIKRKIENLSKKYECKVNIIEEINPFLDKSELIDGIQTANFMTEASFIKTSNRIILGTGPVTAHEINEYITENSYNLLVEQYRKMIIKVCGKK
ncbi:MAG: M20/M25/M40 family metallo-hydrolase [Anaeroplasma sp.]